MADNNNTRSQIGNHETLRDIVAGTLSELIDDQIYNLRAYAFYGDTGLEAVTLPNIRQAGSYAFANCSRLATVNLGYLHNLSAYLFNNCSRLDTVYAAETETSSTSPFAGCSSLQTIYMPELLSLADSMFMGCTRLVDVYMPKLKSGNARAFYGCSSLEEIDLRNLTSVSSYMFQNCTRLRTVLLSSECSSIGAQAFAGCTGLTSISFPNVKTVSNSAFYGCSNLQNIVLPNATSLGQWAFTNVPFEGIEFPKVTTMSTYVFSENGAKEIDFGSKVTLSSNALASDRNLTSLILRSDTLCPMTYTSSLANTPLWVGHGWIYVPDELVDEYKSATNWSAYADRIVSLEEYPIPTIGTIADSWDDIVESEQNGTYMTKYHIGDTKLFTINNVPYLARIIGFNADNRADGLGKAPITWMSTGLYGVSSNIKNTAGNNVRYSWGDSSLRSTMRNTIFPLIGSDLKGYILEVTKSQRVYQSGVSYETTTDTLFVPSAGELGLASTSETGPVYADAFPDEESRRVRAFHYGTGAFTSWWLRTAGTSQMSFYIINGSYTVNENGVNVTHDGGEFTTTSTGSSMNFPICFCT